jgi:type VI secretion system protein ImpE
MEDVIKQIQAGNYHAAYQALERTPEMKTQVGVAVGGFLLALAERFDEADRLLAREDVPSIALIVRGERQRLARWRDPKQAESLAASSPLQFLGVYAGMAVALVQRDGEMVARVKNDMKQIRPVAGRIFLGSEPRAFKNLIDADDAIGQMLETYCGSGLLYFPFSTLRRVEFLPKTNFMDFLMPKVKITDLAGATSHAFVPLLYAGSSTHSEETTRNGRMTTFDYVGEGRRGRGQRDFFADNAMIGLQGVTAIEFANGLASAS